MDAYDISNKMKNIWVENTDKGSGTLSKKYDKMRVCVWTSEGYREVTDLKYNDKLKFIELRLDNE